MKWIFLVSLFLINELSAGRIIQMKDFLCGCAHCETVPTQEPLDIGRHMIMCHTWREATMKTMEIMRETEKPKIKIIKKERKKVTRDRADSHVDIYNDYKWRENEVYGWTYSNTHQVMSLDDMWRYLERLGWVWSFGKQKRFLYSEKYGWLYLMNHKGTRVLYWYDRRIWVLLKNFK